MPYRILYLNLFPEIGGAETSLIYLLQALDKSLFTPFVMIPRAGYFSERLAGTRAKVFFINLPGYTFQTLYLPGLAPFPLIRFIKFCQDFKPDLIHLTHITQAAYAGIVRKLFGIPIVATSWMNSDSVYFYQDLLSQWSIDKILAVTPELQIRLLKKGIIQKNKVDMVMPGLDTEFFKPVKDKIRAKRYLNVNPKSLVITIASRFDPMKDHVTFLTAIEKVCRQTTKPLTILIAQDTSVNLTSGNSARRIKIQIDEFLNKAQQLSRLVKFVGYRKDIRPIYHASDILVSSSLYESLGMIHMEAAACGLPIVSTDFEGQHHIVKNGKTGFLVSIRDYNALANKIHLLLNSSNLRRDFAKAARTHIQHNFAIEKYAREIEKVYLSLLRRSAENNKSKN